ncbi:hypothetical protein [Mesorhizobium sp. KR9-304]|uniref:hypothetical protein n=1 Tax=Mesorhizobium sp. KR9-304 TaxID=3156614 RepID=UPI0032B4D0ED
MRFAVLVGALFASTMLSSAGAFAAEAPRDVGAAFCKARLGDDEAATLALLTPSLAKLVDEAKARNDVIAKATPDEKPPFGDGIPYQAFPDVAQGCEAGEITDKSGRLEIEINYLFPKTPKANWTDRLTLVAVGDRLLIDDIVFANVADGEQDQGLRRVLFDAFDQ